MRIVPPPPPPQHRRAIALAVVALLHAALAALLIFSIVQPQTPPALEREAILYLSPAQKPAPVPQAQASAPAAAPVPAAPPPVPSYNYIAPAPNNAPLFAAPKNDLGRLMQGCAADALARMPPEDRARCRFVFGALPRTDPAADPREKVRGEAYWAAERAAAQTPLRVPCVSAFSKAIANSSVQETGVMLDMGCTLTELGKAAARD